MVLTRVVHGAASCFCVLFLPTLVFSQFPADGKQNAIRTMNVMVEFNRKLVERLALKEAALVNRAEHFRKAAETFTENQELFERGSTLSASGEVFEANLDVGVQVIDPRTPNGFGDPFFRQVNVEMKIELDDIMSVHEKHEVRAQNDGTLQIDISSGWRFIDGVGTLVDSNRGRPYFVPLLGVAPNKIIRRRCDSCTGIHRDIYYRRTSMSGVERKLINMMLGIDYGFHESDCGGSDETCRIDNKCYVDFTLHSTYQDAIDNVNAWRHCETATFNSETGSMFTTHNAPGFPAFSGDAYPVYDQYSLHGNGGVQKDYAFYVEDTIWDVVLGVGRYNFDQEKELESLEEAPTKLAESPHGIIRRLCDDCSEVYKDLYYRRILPVPDDVDIWQILGQDFQDQPGNIHGRDFEIFSTFSDAINFENGWYCGNEAGVVSTPVDGWVTYEAEHYNEVSSSGVKTKTKDGVTFVDFHKGDGSYIEWSNVNGGVGGDDCTLKFRFAVGGIYEELTGALSINGIDEGLIVFPTTHSWETFTYKEFDTICIEEEMIVRLTFDHRRGPHLDSMQVLIHNEILGSLSIMTLPQTRHLTTLEDIEPIFSFNGPQTIPEAVEGYPDAVINGYPSNYVLKFTIKPTGIKNTHAVIFHFTTGEKNEVYGSRSPFVNFQEGTTKLAVKIVTTADDEGIYGDRAFLRNNLELNMNHIVEIRIIGSTRTIIVNGNIELTDSIGPRPLLNDPMNVYLGSPWREAADAIISDISLIDVSVGSICHELCCYPEGSPNDYMLGVCEDTGCNYETDTHGNAYCSGDNYNSCVSTCDDGSTTNSDTSSSYPNIASQGTSSQSTTRHFSNLAIDGMVSTFSFTDAEFYPWWRLDFPNDIAITKIVIWNRVDCCKDRLNDSKVQILNGDDEIVKQYDIVNGDLPSLTFVESSEVIGKAIKVQSNRIEYLHLAEVEVYGYVAYPNIASLGSPSQSSMYSGNHFPGNAIDGDKNTISQTTLEDGAWWRLDFPDDVSITQITIYNRVSCCQERLSGSKVLILDKDDNVNREYEIGNSRDIPSFTFTESSAVAGKAVKVQLSGGGYLHMAEVEVYGQVNTSTEPELYKIVESGTCEEHYSQPIYDRDKCIDAANSLGKTITWGPHGGYPDVIDGCSLRGSNHDQLFLNPEGKCDPLHNVGYWTYTGCLCMEKQPCLCEVVQGRSPPTIEEEETTEQSEDEEGEGEGEEGAIGFPGRCRPHINDPVDSYKLQQTHQKDNLVGSTNDEGPTHYAFYIEGEAIIETSEWMSEDDEMNIYMDPGASLDYDAEKTCAEPAISVDTDSHYTGVFPEGLQPYVNKGQPDPYAGWYDIQGCGTCNDWCGWFSTDDSFDGGMNPHYQSWTSGNDMFACISGLPSDVRTSAVDNTPFYASFIPYQLNAEGSDFASYLHFFPTITRCSSAYANSPPKPDYKYLGCYKDTEDRALPHYAGVHSFDSCYATCKYLGWQQFGRQYNNQCFCGGSNEIYVASSSTDYSKHGLTATNVGSGEQSQSGIEHNVLDSEITDKGWVKCYTGTYTVDNQKALSDIKNDCQGTNIMYGCRETSSAHWKLIGYGNRTKAFTPSDSNGVVDGAVKWYFSEDLGGMGFANSNDELDLRPCDRIELESDNRLCWHVSDNTMNDGWRCGDESWLNSDTTWERSIWTTNTAVSSMTYSEPQCNDCEGSSIGSWRNCVFQYTKPISVKYYDAPSLSVLPSSGLDGHFEPYFTDTVGTVNFTDTSGNFATSGRKDNVAALFQGYVDFDVSGTYELCITSDDGSKLFLDNELIVNNDGLHDDIRECTSKTLVGIHKVDVEFFEASGGATLILEWKRPTDTSRSAIPEYAWSSTPSTLQELPECLNLDVFDIPNTQEEFPPDLIPYTYQVPVVDDPFAGYYDVHRCGKCNDYCFWAGPSKDGSGLNPKWQTQTGTDFFTCKLAGGSSSPYGMTERDHFGTTFPYTKCQGEGAATPASRKEEFLGCFHDKVDDRALSMQIGQGVLDLEECADSCRDKGYHYFGRQDQGSCYCGGESASDHNYAKHGMIGPQSSEYCSSCDGNNIGMLKQCVFQILDQYDPEVERKKHECSHIPAVDVRRHCYVSCRDSHKDYKNLLTCQTLKVTGLTHLNNEIALWRDSPICDTKNCLKDTHPLGNDLQQSIGVR